MFLWVMIAVAIVGTNLVLRCVFAISGRETRRDEEEAARKQSAWSGRAA